MTRIVLAALVVLLAGCGADSDAPSDHAVEQDGVRHKAGLQQPLANCTGCHGPSLQGASGPSCTSCHGVKW